MNIIKIYQKPKKRSILIHGHSTSISLEDNFWNAFCAKANMENISINRLISEIDLHRNGKCSLAGAIRLYVLSSYTSSEWKP